MAVNMMQAIWKFSIEITGLQAIMMPEGAKILAVAVQRGSPFLWAIVDPEAPKLERMISLVGTGQFLPENPGTYIGTFQTDGGSFVFHVYDLAKRSAEHLQATGPRQMTVGRLTEALLKLDQRASVFVATAKDCAPLVVVNKQHGAQGIEPVFLEGQS